MKQCQKLTVANKKARLQKWISPMKRATNGAFQMIFQSFYSQIELQSIQQSNSIKVYSQFTTVKSADDITPNPLWFEAGFVRLVKHRFLSLMKASKSTIERTVKISSKVLCLPSLKRNWDMKNDFSIEILFENTEQEVQRNAANHIFQISWQPKNSPCLIQISNRWVILNDHLTEQHLY